MVGVTPSLLTSLPGHRSFGKSSHQSFQSSQSGAGRELQPLSPSFSPFPQRSSQSHQQAPNNHWTTPSRCWVCRVKGAASVRVCLWPPFVPTLPVARHPLGACLSIHGWGNPTFLGAQGPIVVFSGCKLAMLNLAHSRKPSTNKADTLMSILSYLS